MMHRALFAAALLLAACGQNQTGYPPEIAYNFTQACEAQRPAAGVCGCIWERIEANVPRAEFEALERLSPAQRTEHPLTAQIEGFALACAQPENGDIAEPPPP
ncbi:MAG: hypothetical protein JNK94_08630 [Hyphomonadaceae bacterium]|nr:hypothetical protein [Hyphomonadaceae bacterium]MBX3510380.1 hypothetical protein [Hyphomonadaceae bacterium]